MTNSSFSRRSFFMRSAAISSIGVLAPFKLLAFSEADARSMIDDVVVTINDIINSGQTEQKLYQRFEGVLTKYADMPSIARSVLGPVARTTNPSTLDSFQRAFQSYLSEKYGAQFRTFIGGEIAVNSVTKLNSIYDVRCVAKLKGRDPLQISFIVHQKSERFIDLQIEGISLLKSERVEIRSRLDRVGGSVEALSNSLI